MNAWKDVTIMENEKVYVVQVHKIEKKNQFDCICMVTKDKGKAFQYVAKHASTTEDYVENQFGFGFAFVEDRKLSNTGYSISEEALSWDWIIRRCENMASNFFFC